MKISSFSFNNFLCYSRTDKIETSEKINVFIGENNSGKSSILKAFHALMNQSSLNSKHIRLNNNQAQLNFYYKGNPNNFVKYQKKDRQIFEDLQSNDEQENVPWYSDEEDLGSDLRLKYIHEKFKNQEFTIKIEKNKIITGLVSNIVDATGENLITEIIFHSERPNNYIVPIFANRKTNQYSNDVSENNYKRIETGFHTLPALIDTASNAKFNEKFQKYTEDILGIKVYASHEGHGKNIKQIIDDTTELNIENLGDGIPVVIALIANLVIGENKLYLIEEIENDLHPKALKKVLDMIIEFSDRNQFILTTHSNIVLRHLGAIQSTKIFEVQKDNAKTIPTSSIVEINGEEERRRVLQDLGYEMEDFGLWEAWLLLEEASAETLIRNYIIPLFFPKLKNKLRTFSCRGITQVEDKFKFLNNTFVYLDLSKQYHNKVWVIVDFGEVGSKEQNLIVNLAKSYGNKSESRNSEEKPVWDETNFAMLSKHDFEEYYPEEFKTKAEINEILSEKKQTGREDKKHALLKDFRAYLDKTEESEQKKILQNNFQELIDKITIINSALTQ